MGQEANTNREKTPLIDFLYKDINLINSFYSQLFGGDLTNIEKSEISIDESDTTLGGSAAGFVKGKVSSKHANNQNIVQNINPYDYKVIELLQEFNLKKTYIKDAQNGSIIATDGSITYRNFDIITKILPFISKSDLVPDFKKPVYPNEKGKLKNLTIGSMIQEMIKLLPYGLEFELTTSNGENATCILKQDYLTISTDDLFRSYGTSIPSNWTIVGIVDISEKRTQSSNNQFRSMIDFASKAIEDMVLDSGTLIIRPIAIYRRLTY